MKARDIEDLPEYIDEYLSEAVQRNNEKKLYSDEIVYEYEPVGTLNNKEWVVPTEKEKEENMITETFEYGKLDLPPEFWDFIEKSANEDGLNRSEVVKIGLTLLKLAKKVKSQGLNLAVIDNSGTLLSTIDY